MEKIFKTKEGREIVLNAYQEVLKKWPVENRQYQVNTTVGSTFIIECGNNSNPHLMLIHGSVSNSFTWFSDVIELSKYFYVFAIDIIGEPGFSEARRPKYKSGSYEQWIKEVLKALKISACYMTGISLGGWMALNFSVHYPDMVKGLFLISPGGLARENPSFLWKVLFYKLTGKNEKIQALVNGGKTTTETPKLKKAMAFTALMSKHFKPRYGRLPLFSPDELTRLTMPVMMVFGEKDYLISGEKSRQSLLKSVRHAKVMLLPDTGHIVLNQTKNMIDFFNKTD
jgi:pimeloyl-ACP methyl ester carboxylesterase